MRSGLASCEKQTGWTAVYCRALRQILADFNDRHHHTIHINGNDIPSGIDRPGFDGWRRRYWINRANDIEPKPPRAARRGSTPSDGGDAP